MEFIDTHTHLFAEEFDNDREIVIARSLQNGVNTMLLPNIDFSTISALKSCAENSNGSCLPMMGLHPCSVGQNFRQELDLIKQELYSGYSYAAVGEIGIDLFWDTSTLEAQKSAFIEQCEWAAKLNLAVSVHTRNAVFETISCLKSMKKRPKGIFHCFTGSIEDAKEILKLDFKLGIGGVLTYKNSNLPEVLKQLSPEDLVLETDAPYLPPVPYRGKRNESSYIPLIAEKLATLFELSMEEIAFITTNNAKLVFGL